MSVSGRRKKRIYYLFRRPVIKELAKAKKGEYPEDFFYGFTRLSKKFDLMVSDQGEANRLIKLAHALLNEFITPHLGLSCSLFPALVQITKLRKADIIFATVDSYGIALALLKSLGLLGRQKLVWNTIGLCDALVENDSSFVHRLYRRLAKNADLFVSLGSKTECHKLAQLLTLPLSRFTFVPFGIDTDYFAPIKATAEDFILSIGADRRRDWQLYKRLAKEFSQQNFIVITHPNLISFAMPNNVKIFYNLPIEEVRDFIARSKIVVILSHQNYYFAGHSTAFRAMSMEKPVIFTDSHGTFEYGLINGKECFLVKPGDFSALKEALSMLLRNKKLRLDMGTKARKKIKKEFSLNQYTTKLTRLFKKL